MAMHITGSVHGSFPGVRSDAAKAAAAQALEQDKIDSANRAGSFLGTIAKMLARETSRNGALAAYTATSDFFNRVLTNATTDMNPADKRALTDFINGLHQSLHS